MILEWILDQKETCFRTIGTNLVRSVESIIVLYQCWLPDFSNSTVMEENVLVTRKYTVKYLRGEGYHVQNLQSNGTEEK